MARKRVKNKAHTQVTVYPMLYVTGTGKRTMRHAADCPCPHTAKHGAPSNAG